MPRLAAEVPNVILSLISAAASRMVEANACVTQLANIANPEGTNNHAGSTQRQLVNQNMFPIQFDDNWNS